MLISLSLSVCVNADFSFSLSVCLCEFLSLSVFLCRSGNFQESNFGRGGKEVDAVQANGQDGAGTNNGTRCAYTRIRLSCMCACARVCRSCGRLDAMGVS
jgi:hypothetical protein